MASFRDLSRRLARVRRNLRTGVERYASSVGAEVADLVVDRTPVDTGYARGNWQAALNVPIVDARAFLDPTGSASVAQIAAVSGQFRLGDTIFITNTAPYIGALNDGHSPQADPGYIEDAVIDGVANARARLRLNL